MRFQRTRLKKKNTYTVTRRANVILSFSTTGILSESNIHHIHDEETKTCLRIQKFRRRGFQFCAWVSKVWRTHEKPMRGNGKAKEVRLGLFQSRFREEQSRLDSNVFQSRVNDVTDALVSSHVSSLGKTACGGSHERHGRRTIRTVAARIPRTTWNVLTRSMG